MKFFTIILWLFLGLFYYFFWDYQYTQCCLESGSTNQVNEGIEKSKEEGLSSTIESLVDSSENQSPKPSIDSSSTKQKLRTDTLVFYFDYNSSALQIPEAYKDQLNTLMIYLDENPKSALDIIGHTDNLGASEANLKVGLNRAKKMKAYLQTNGVKNNIICKSMGEDQPIADNSTYDGRSKNRRIELTLKNY